MTATEEDFFTPNSSSPNGESPPQYVTIADAEDYEKFIRKPQTAISREYNKRVKSMLKAGMFGAINTGNLSDAAAIVHYGPDFATAMGDLADTDERIRKVMDMITTPANPYAMAFMVSLPFLAQLFRNHEEVLREVPATWRERRKARRYSSSGDDTAATTATVKLPFGRKINLRFRLRLRNPLKLFMAGARSRTYSPDTLTVKVFSDPKLRTALEKQGIRIQVVNNDQP